MQQRNNDIYDLKIQIVKSIILWMWRSVVS
jgi:hypothetical protein